ncbi:MAG: DUF4062 domain-containing protein [Verrucomicrobiota bacterium]
MSEKRIFVSSLFTEFAQEREALKQFIDRDERMRDFFELFLSEDSSNQITGQSFIAAIDRCDIFIGLIGKKAGPVISDEKTAVELEFEQALSTKKLCLIFVKGLNDSGRDVRMTALIRKAGAQLLYRRFRNKREFDAALRDGLLPHLHRLRGTFGPETEPEYHIVFVHAPASVPYLQKPAIVLAPASEPPNEFGQRTLFRYQIMLHDVPPIEGHLHLGFVDEGEDFRSPADAVEHLLGQMNSGEMLKASDVPEFYTLQPDMESYRKLIGALDGSRARGLLASINDLVVAGRTQPPPNWLNEAMNSNQFNFSFMRNSETFFALRNAESLLGGLAAEELAGISNQLHLSFKLPTFQTNHEIDFRFENDGPLPKRIAVVIGKNGVGKSQSLAHIVESLLHDDRDGLRDPVNGRPVINRLLAVSSPGETYTTFPPPPRFPRRIKYRQIFLSRRQWGNNELGLGRVLVELSRSEESIRAKGRWSFFCEAIRPIIPPELLYVRVKKANVNTPEWLKEPFPLSELQEGNGRRRLERWSAVDLQADVCRYIDGKHVPLSSGQLTFIRFAIQACLYIENGTLILCDEPETHLHPNFISDFVRLLDKLLEETGSVAILATHSAYFVREVTRSQVIVLRQVADNQIEAVTPRLKTLGADIGEISHFVFEDAYFGSLLAQVRAHLVAKPGQAPKVMKLLEEEVSTEALMSLQRADLTKAK